MHPLSDIEFRELPCPVCESNDSSILFRDINRREPIDIQGTYVRCCKCGLIYLCPAPCWDEFKSSYDWLFGVEAGEAKSVAMPLGDRKGPVGWLFHQLRRFRFRPHSWPQETGDN